jgi:hypothetical protein
LLREVARVFSLRRDKFLLDSLEVGPILLLDILYLGLKGNADLRQEGLVGLRLHARLAEVGKLLVFASEMKRAFDLDLAN